MKHPYRSIRVLFLLFTLSFLYGCDFLTSALPPTPSPFPTLARLPTVTPTPLMPTSTPTVVPSPEPPTPTPAPPEVLVIVGANLRAGPGTDQPVLDILPQGSTVTIYGNQGEWFKVVTEDEIEGWMAAEVLDVSPEMTTIVPTIVP